jgi:hypothetical protein
MSSFAIGFGIRLIYGLGMGITMAPVTESIMGSLPRERAGVGSAINDTTRQTGGAMGVAVLGSIFAFNYHRVIDTTTGISAATLHNARDSIGKSLEVARNVGGAAGAHLVDAAQQAFISSMRITFGVAALVVLFAALVAAKFLPARAADTGETLGEEVADSLVVGIETAT